MTISKRTLLKSVGALSIGAAISSLDPVEAATKSLEQAPVVGIKLHTGERHGPNILPRDMVKAFQAQVPNSTIVETNTLYEGDRYTTKDHLETLKVNGWTFCPVDIIGVTIRFPNT